jgi:hypothetical protein
MYNQSKQNKQKMRDVNVLLILKGRVILGKENFHENFLLFIIWMIYNIGKLIIPFWIVTLVFQHLELHPQDKSKNIF